MKRNPNHFLCQINLAKGLDHLGSETMREFRENIAKINALGKAFPGFVWLFETEAAPDLGRNTLVNMSVWRDVESLKRFVYQSDHARFFMRRREWFEKPKEAHTAIWWRKDDAMPTLEEGIERLETLRRQGPSPEAFGFRRVFPKPTPVVIAES